MPAGSSWKQEINIATINLHNGVGSFHYESFVNLSYDQARVERESNLRRYATYDLNDLDNNTITFVTAYFDIGLKNNFVFDMN